MCAALPLRVLAVGGAYRRGCLALLFSDAVAEEAAVVNKSLVAMEEELDAAAKAAAAAKDAADAVTRRDVIARLAQMARGGVEE